jgi:hypothetical protein
MLLDISGNTFLSLGNTALPTVIYNPQQIFGTGLTLWYDFSDKSVLFTNTAATINVQNDGDPVMYVRNKGVGESGSNFDLGSYIGRSNFTSRINTSAITYTNNFLNTNKGIGRYAVGATAQTVNHLRMINGLTFSASTGQITSALTFSCVFRAATPVSQGTIMWNVGPVNCCVPFQVIYTTSNRISIEFATYVNCGGGRPTGLTITIPYVIDIGKHNVVTVTLNENNVAKYYVNNDFAASATAYRNIHPITSDYAASLCRGGIYEGQGCVQEAQSQVGGGASVQEIMFSKGTVLTDDQVYKLHRYFKTRYDI